MQQRSINNGGNKYGNWRNNMLKTVKRSPKEHSSHKIWKHFGLMEAVMANTIKIYKS